MVGGGGRFHLFIFSVHFSFCSFADTGRTSQCRSVVVVVVSIIFRLKIIGWNFGAFQSLAHNNRYRH